MYACQVMCVFACQVMCVCLSGDVCLHCNFSTTCTHIHTCTHRCLPVVLGSLLSCHLACEVCSHQSEPHGIRRLGWCVEGRGGMEERELGEGWRKVCDAH